MTKLQKSQIIYADLVYVLNKFGIDITSKEIESVIKGTIHSSLEKIEQSTIELTFERLNWSESKYSKRRWYHWERCEH